MSSRLPTWHTYARRVHRTHACVATNRLLTANILKSIAPIRTRKRDFLVHLQLCHFNKRSNRSFCNCFRRGCHCSEKTEIIPNGQLTANLPIGDIICVMYYSPIAQQTAHIIAAEKAIEPTTKINIQIQAATIQPILPLKNLSVINCIKSLSMPQRL